MLHASRRTAIDFTILTVPQHTVVIPAISAGVNPTNLRARTISEGITTKICSPIVAELHDPIEKSMRFVSDDKMDPILEMWIDYSRSPVAVRLDGVLDGATRSAFLSVMSDLMLEGVQTVVIDAGAVEIVDALGAEALAFCHRRLREAGRMLIWDGVDCASPSSHSSECRSFRSRRSSTPAR
jgi:hypothetical protein